MIGYILLLLFLIYIAVVYNSTALIFLVGVGVLLPLFLVGILIFQTYFLKILFQNKIIFLEAEEKEKIILSAYNGTIFPIKQMRLKVKMKNLTTGEKKKLWIKTALERGENDILLPIERLSYGVWQISCKNIKIYDWLKMFRLSQFSHSGVGSTHFFHRSALQQEIIRLPRRYEIDFFNGTLEYDEDWEQEEYEPWKTGNDASYIREIREYRPGDKPRSIHWKLSAKKEQLLVKEYGQPVGGTLLFGIDTKTVTPEDMENIYSLLYACAKKEISLYLIWQTRGKQEPVQWEIKQEEDVYWAMEHLMREKPVQWKGEPDFEFEHQLWLKEKMLYLDGVEMQDFSTSSSTQSNKCG